MQHILSRLAKNEFTKNVILLVGGTLFAQVLQLVFSPILTRIYNPDEFGVLSTYLSVISILTSFSSLRYEISILLPKAQPNAMRLMIISISLLLFFSVILFLLLLIIRERLLAILDNNLFEKVIFLLPIGVLILGLNQIFTNYAIRYERYKIISQSKMLQSFSQGGFQAIFGLLNFSGYGLILGDVISRLVSSVNLFRFVIVDLISVGKYPYKRLFKLATIYRKFPLYSAPSALLNNISSQSPAILFVIMYGSTSGGLFALVQRLMGIPISLIGQSVAQVYLGVLSNQSQKKGEGLLSLFLKTSRRLFLIALFPTILLYLVAPNLFGLFFGEEWEAAGGYFRILSLMFLSQFVVIPLSQTLNVMNKQKWQFYWDLIRSVVIIGEIFASFYCGFSIIIALTIFGLTMTISYIVLFYLSFISIKQTRWS